MKFAFKTLFTAAIFVGALALPSPTFNNDPPTETPAPVCAQPLCCQKLTTASDGLAGLLLGLLGIVVKDLTIKVGITCSPSAVSSCSQQPVCCTNNSFNGVLALGCEALPPAAVFTTV